MCQASKVFLIQKEPLSMTLELSKSMRWSNDHACFACFVVLDKCDYDSKMDSLLSDRSTYELIPKSPFKRIERELNKRLLALKNQHKISDSTYRKLRSSDAIPPAIRGSIKHHKQGNPVRPIVSSIGSALYNTSKFLTDILSPLQNGNGFSTPNSAKFAEEISNVDIQDDEVMLSFDVVSLFTAIPVDKACDYIHKKLLKDETLHARVWTAMKSFHC